jgi:hypothetical protein
VADPSRSSDRTLRVLPRFTKSNTLKLDPSRAMPYAAMEDPSRHKLRSDMDEPRSTKSKTLRLDPSRVVP